MSYPSSASSRPKALSRLADDEVLYRTVTAMNELHVLVGREAVNTVLILGSPQAGKSELLRLTFDWFFHEHRRALPCYFSLRRDRLTPDKFAKDFLNTLLRHYLAFAHQDSELILRTDLTERDLLNLAQAIEYPLLKDVLDGYDARVADGDEAALVRYVLATPQRLAARSPYNIVVMLDEAQWIDRLALSFGEDAAAILSEAILSTQSVSFVLAGQQRTLLDQLSNESGLLSAFKIIHLAPPETTALQSLAEQWCIREAVAFEPETLRLAIQQTDGNLAYIRALVTAASDRKMNFSKGADFERLYVAELLQGRLAHHFSGQVRRLAQDATGGTGVEHAAIEVVYICYEAITSRAPVDMIERRLRPRLSASPILNELHHYEMVTLLDGHVLPSDDQVFCDWIRATHRRFEGASLEEVKLDLLRRSLKAIPQLLALSARRSLHAQLEELLKRFDGQSVARSLFAHDEFVIRYGRATYENMIEGLKAEIERIELPQIVHVAESHLFAPKPERGPTIWSCLLAYGFDQGIYDHEHEIIWLLALADAPSAVTEEAVQALDYQMKEIEAALASGDHTPRMMRWAISKMGFTADGTVALEERGFAASDYLQLDLLTETIKSGSESTSTKTENEPAPLIDDSTLDEGETGFEAHTPLTTTPPEVPVTGESSETEATNAESGAQAILNTDEQEKQSAGRDFEVAIPMNDDKEIIAARVAEQVARGAGFSPEAVNQIKTALIECCLSISASEEMADNRIHQRYHTDKERLTIIISNSAAGLDATEGERLENDPERIWRLDVLRSLVDEVKLQRLSNGWRVELTRLVR